MFCTKIMIQQRFDDFRVALSLLQEGQHLTSRKPVSLHQQPQVFGGIRVNGKGSNDTQLGIIRQDVASVSKSSRQQGVKSGLCLGGSRGLLGLYTDNSIASLLEGFLQSGWRPWNWKVSQYFKVDIFLGSLGRICFECGL